MFSDCIRISGEIQDRCRVQNRPSADPKTRRIGAQAIGTKKDTPKRTRILPFREFAIRRNPCIHFLQLRAIVAGLLFCRNQNLGLVDWTAGCVETAQTPQRLASNPMSTGTLQSEPRVNWPRSVSQKRHLNRPLCNFCSCCPCSPSYNNPPPPLFWTVVTSTHLSTIVIS